VPRRQPTSPGRAGSSIDRFDIAERGDAGPEQRQRHEVDHRAGGAEDGKRREHANAPLALGVITGTGYGIVRKDGVLEIPIGALRA
jgi:hypothetical protein